MPHRYQTHLRWQGSTAKGYRAYDRAHEAVTPPSQDVLRLSADPAFRGDPARHNPEQLLLAAASSCQLLSFLALAAQEGIDVLSYEDDAEAVMPANAAPARITEIVLRPQVVVARGADREQVLTLIGRAHEQCYVANTLNADVRLEPVVEAAP